VLWAPGLLGYSSVRAVDNNGGAVYVANVGLFIAEGCVIDSARALSRGGAVFVGKGGAFIMTRTQFHRCTSNLYGGAVHVASDAQLIQRDVSAADCLF
jgi:hypothetical protein